MTIIEIMGWVFLAVLLLYVILARTVFRKWFMWGRLVKGIVGLLGAMAVGFGAIYACSLLLSLVGVFQDYIEKAAFSDSYISLVGDSPYGATMGLVVIIIAFMITAVWAINKVGDYCTIPYNEKEKELVSEEKEWWNNKMPKWLQYK